MASTTKSNVNLLVFAFPAKHFLSVLPSFTFFFLQSYTNYRSRELYLNICRLQVQLLPYNSRSTNFWIEKNCDPTTYNWVRF